jgi:hypothetical protein
MRSISVSIRAYALAVLREPMLVRNAANAHRDRD